MMGVVQESISCPLLLNTTFIFSLVFLVSLHGIEGHILRLTCKEYANFSIIKNDYALQGSLLRTIANTDVADCEKSCIDELECKSINTENSSPKTCELHSKSTEDVDDAVTLTAKGGWTYRTTDYNQLLIGEICQDLNPCGSNFICRDTCSCPGYQCIDDGFLDCKTIFNVGMTTSGVYHVKHSSPSVGFFPAYCDFSNAISPWLVFQRRVDASVDFYRNYSQYKKGFGSMTGNFWLGLDQLYSLAKQERGAKLRIDLRFPDRQVYAEYSLFKISNEADGYRCTVGGFTGNGGDAMSPYNNYKFSTFDKDQDAAAHDNCALSYKGGWWYGACYQANLNGMFPINPSGGCKQCMSWFALRRSYGDVIFSEMKLRY